MMGNYFGGGYGFMGGFGFFFMILFWGLIIWAIVAGIRMMSHGGNHGGGSCCGGGNKENTAQKVLRERYAKGEITKEQFDQMKKDLSV
jgi:putative membrane protein